MVETTEPVKENINPNANAEFEVDEFSANIVKSSQLRKTIQADPVRSNQLLTQTLETLKI